MGAKNAMCPVKKAADRRAGNVIFRAVGFVAGLVETDAISFNSDEMLYTRCAVYIYIYKINISEN